LIISHQFSFLAHQAHTAICVCPFVIICFKLCTWEHLWFQ